MLECSPDGSERQAIKDTDGDVPRPRIRHCSICDPFILIIREDDSIGLFVGEAERGKIRRKDMSPMGEKVRYRLLRGVLRHIHSSMFRRRRSTLQVVSIRTRVAYSKLTRMPRLPGPRV